MIFLCRFLFSLNDNLTKRDPDPFNLGAAFEIPCCFDHKSHSQTTPKWNFRVLFLNCPRNRGLMENGQRSIRANEYVTLHYVPLCFSATGFVPEFWI